MLAGECPKIKKSISASFDLGIRLKQIPSPLDTKAEEIGKWLLHNSYATVVQSLRDIRWVLCSAPPPVAGGDQATSKGGPATLSALFLKILFLFLKKK